MYYNQNNSVIIFTTINYLYDNYSNKKIIKKQQKESKNKIKNITRWRYMLRMTEDNFFSLMWSFASLSALKIPIQRKRKHLPNTK